MRNRLGALLLLSACSDRPRGDAGWYWYALSQAASFDEATDACAHIGLPSSKNDCQLAAIEAWDRVDGDTCAQIPLPLWREGCLFQYAHALAADGDRASALEVCEELRVARWCAYQQLDDAVAESLDEAPAIAEARIDEFVHIQSLSDAPLQFWTLRFRADSKRGHGLDPQVCDALKDPRPCALAVNQALRKLMDGLSRRDLALACGVAKGEVAYPGTVPWVDSPPLRSFLEGWSAARCEEAQAPAAAPPGG